MSRKQKQREYATRANNRERQGNKKHTSQKKNTPNKVRNEHIIPEPLFKEERVEDNPRWKRFRETELSKLPPLLPRDDGRKFIKVFVEGYEDVSFWRGIFDLYEDDRFSFGINVPPRADLAKGKKVIMGMIPESTPETILCVDSDFDYLFGDTTEQSRIINSAPYLFHTYAYSTENYLCYAPSLHNVCVRATKNDAWIFDFVKFMADYSRIIYPLFLWYAYSAQLANENLFTLLEFKSSVRLNYLDIEDNGQKTIEWLSRQVEKRQNSLRNKYPHHEDQLNGFEKIVSRKGVTPENTYMYIQGHTLMDNVVIVALNAVCEELKMMCNVRIATSTKTGIALKNEQSNYNNSLRNIREILLDNEGYKESPEYKLLKKDIERHLAKIK